MERVSSGSAKDAKDLQHGRRSNSVRVDNMDEVDGMDDMDEVDGMDEVDDMDEADDTGEVDLFFGARVEVYGSYSLKMNVGFFEGGGWR